MDKVLKSLYLISFKQPIRFERIKRAYLYNLVIYKLSNFNESIHNQLKVMNKSRVFCWYMTNWRWICKNGANKCNKDKGTGWGEDRRSPTCALDNYSMSRLLGRGLLWVWIPRNEFENVEVSWSPCFLKLLLTLFCAKWHKCTFKQAENVWTSGYCWATGYCYSCWLGLLGLIVSEYIKKDQFCFRGKKWWWLWLFHKFLL